MYHDRVICILPPTLMKTRFQLIDAFIRSISQGIKDIQNTSMDVVCHDGTAIPSSSVSHACICHMNSCMHFLARQDTFPHRLHASIQRRGVSHF